MSTDDKFAADVHPAGALPQSELGFPSSAGVEVRFRTEVFSLVYNSIHVKFRNLSRGFRLHFSFHQWPKWPKQM
jgi:hypothetical protein